MRLFQYWDTGEPPDDVAAWIEGFRSMNPEMQHALYDRDRASWFIGKYVGERERRAFDELLVPSMQADYFRACAVFAKGGAYLDADSIPGEPLASLYSRAAHSLVMIWSDDLQPGVLMFRERGDALLKAWLDRMTVSIEKRQPGNASEVTGPIALTSIYSAALERDLGPISAAARRLTTIPWSEAARWIGVSSGAYKEGPRHWMNWIGPVYAGA